MSFTPVAVGPFAEGDSKIHKRPMNRARVYNRGGPPLSPKEPIIYIGTKSPFMGIVSKVRHALDKAPSSRSTKGLPLAARMAALNSPASSADRLEDEILVRGTGRAMTKSLQIAAWFGNQKEYMVSVRTMSLEAVDDVVVGEDGADDEGGFAAEEDTRMRMVNCLEVGISLR
ncbi:Rpp20 subunit of nuclear RNase MRP and P-domain-containing protein [Diaporthe sp. PMI_573]|nr:Rpp20 subunit of nuclear RNase MRP and P-domain-containing protein [Diaporthaceae sp. PMI_573]